MPYRRRYKRRGRSMNLATPKLASQVGIWQNPTVFLPNQFPHVQYQRFATALPMTAERIMGIKITAVPNVELKPGTGNANSVMMGLGILKATAVETNAFGAISQQTDDQIGKQVFRRVFARESTIEKVTKPGSNASTSSATSGASLTSLIQRRVKGHVDIDNGQALYLATWYQAHQVVGTGEQAHLDVHIEYSFTTRSYNG